MSRATVRAAIAAWFAPPNVAFVGYIYRAQPKIELPVLNKNTLTVGSPSSASGVVWIAKEREMRIAAGGPTGGYKHILYDCSLVLHFNSVHPQLESAMDDFDVMIESVKERLRAGRATVLGTSTGSAPLFNVGEDAPGIDIDYDMPTLVQNVTYIWAALSFGVEEIIYA